MKIPVILYDIDNNSIQINCVAKNSTFFVRSFQNFSIEVLSNFNSDTNTTIYSAKQNPAPLNANDIVTITDSYRFEEFENFAYTIFLESDIQIRVWNITGESCIYNIEYRPENLEPEHYNDLLINNNLPKFTELLPCIIDSNTSELIKRLLLDFKYILKHKGTITGINKFLNLIGFDPESIIVYPEFLTPTGNKTINPNTLTDIKTGDYHVLFNNYTIDTDDKWTEKNMPKALLGINNLEDFFDKLYHALTLANIYFTLPEQDISFFGINYMSNNEQYLSICGNTYITYSQNPHFYNNNLKINLFSHYNSTLKKHLIIDNRQVNNITEKSEIKYSNIVPENNNELFLVDTEYYDDVDLNFNIKSIFGNLLNLTVFSPNTYVNYSIEKIDNVLTKLKTENVFLTEQPLVIKYVSTVSGQYKLVVTITDFWNNQDIYTYLYSIDENNAIIDFVMYNSAKLNEDILNEINLDVSSPSINTKISDNYILPQLYVPDLLNTYFDVDITNIDGLKFLSNKKKYITPEINKNFIVDSSTDMPVDYMDNWLHVISIQKIPGYNLKLRCINPNTNLVEYIDIGTSEIENDRELFITNLTIIEQINNGEQELDYLFISTQSGGIDIIKELFDLVLINETDNDICSIYEMINHTFIGVNVNFLYSQSIFTETKIPLNYDIELFHREELLDNYPVIDDLHKPLIKSLFPRLTKDNYNVKLGDIVGCVPNKNYISNQRNIKWEVRNSFNDELLFETTDHMLKYRINDNLIYTIILMFGVGNDSYVVEHKSIVSSYTL